MKRHNAYLDGVSTHDFSYIVAPLIVMGGHWNAIIIDIKNGIFHLLDPKFQPDHEFSAKLLSSWQAYYDNRIDHVNGRKWVAVIDHEHPKQLYGQ